MTDKHIVINTLGKRAGTLTVHVRTSGRFRLRAWLAIRLIRLAAWVAPLAMDVQAESER